MPVSSRRRTRRKLQEASDAEALDSSPSRPSVKKRKVERRSSPPPQRVKTPDPASAEEADDSSVENEISVVQDLVDSVIASLSVARDEANAVKDHSNAKAESKQSIRAYAKIAGRDWTYYVKTLHVNIGRPPDREQKLDEQSSPVTIAARALPEVHVDLGPSKFVSRLHAEVFFDGEGSGSWRIRVNGRNGVRLNNVVLKRGTAALLNCGDIFEIANTQMMFVTPDVKKPEIQPFFIERARRWADGEEPLAWDASQHAHPPYPPQPVRRMSLISSNRNTHDVCVAAAVDGSRGKGGRGGGERQSLAPASKLLKRQTTPPPRSPDAGRAAKQSPLYNRGMMMESTEEIDYSQDSAKDLKPPYSYATMIAQAIFSSEEEKLTLSSIYQCIMEKYAFYRHSQSGWQNSIRHNLSLNKAFQKVPRRTDEPGKGMKWQIAPEHRQEYLKKQTRKGTQSSAPSSPATKEGPSTRGVNGRTATGYEGVFSAALGGKGSPPAPSPRFTTFSVAPVEAYTPERGSRAGRVGQDLHRHHNLTDYEEPSPLPTRPRNRNTSRAYGFSDNVAGSPPALSSSYYDDGPSSIITPAPQRQQPRLPPPSTAQIPSKFMPMSSPAQFWKFADIGSTPARPIADLSPVKGAAGPDADGLIPSSSPPPPSFGSPSKPGRSGGGRILQPIKREVDGDPTPLSGMNGTEKQLLRAPGLDEDGDDDDDDCDNNSGFDLARGFQPIGSYHRQLSNVARASASTS